MARPSWNAAVAREPAASLVASHLAPHLTQKPGFHHQQLNRETFSQLLEIINSQECKTLSLAEGINSICVSLKAGIQPFFELKSPQEKREHKGQILDCLKIVTRGSFMKPEALLAPADPVILGKNVTASLSDWVVRDVLLLLCSVNDEEIYAGVVDLLQCVCLRSSMRIFDILSASLHVSLADLLASVEESGYCPTAPICFPGNSGFFLASLGELGCTRLIFDRTSTLDDFAHVVAVCVCIFKATTVALQHMTMITPAKPASLMLRNFNELWDSFLVIIEESGSSAIEQCLVRSLDVLLLELGQAYRFLVLEPSHQKFAWQIMERLLNCCVDLLSCSKLSHNSSLQRSLGQLLHGIQENNILFSENGGTVLRETLGPELRRFLADNESSVEPLIQNFAARLLGGVDESTINLDYHSFQNNDQQTRKHTIGLDGEEESTVRKRRRLNSSDCVDADSIELSSYGLTIDTNGIVRGLHGFSERLNPCLMGESAGPILAEIGYMSCICAGSLDVPRHRERCDISSFCSICDSISSPVLKHAVWSDPDADELLKALLKILPALTDQVDSRVTAALTMKKILMHCPQEEHLILQTSPVGEACLQFLRSSIREVRIATTKTITAFLQKRLKSAIRRDNFMSVLDFLQHMLDSKDMTLMETAILAFTQVAKAAGDREMNIILLRLVEVLGHENPFLSDVAFSEMFSLAEAADIMPFELFKPFWRTISILAIVNMDKRPKILSQLCELTMMSLEAFLRSSQEYIIPYLVSMKKYDIIEMIDPERRLSCMDICKQESNLTSLLAFLLTQPSGNYDTLVTSTFTDMSPDTDSHTLNEWVSIQGIEVTCELLRELGESTQENRPTYLRALELVASLKPTRRAASSVKEGSTLA
ncbi:serine/threonine-protein kinase M1, partial [Ascosphaera aggregata]